jgi:hypothetical protein
MSQDPLDPEFASIEAALGKLVPARSRLDRDQLMFQAGAISTRPGARSRWVWPSMAAMLAVVALSESVALAVRPNPQVVVVQMPKAEPAAETKSVQVVPVEILSQSPSAQPTQTEAWLPAANEAVALKRQVLRFGLEGLPDAPPLVSRSSDEARTNDVPELLRRYEIDKFLIKGGPS